jgi:hypothetical protein
MSDNPFEDSKYSQLQSVPDVPVSTGNNMIETMISNDDVPEDIREINWWIFNKDVTLGFLDVDRKRSKLLNFDIIKLDHLTTLKRREYTFDKEKDYSILRHVLEQKLERAVGSPSSNNIINERKALISQISENRNVQESEDSMVREGFLKKLIGKRR